jgi:hypothetical protein
MEGFGGWLADGFLDGLDNIFGQFGEYGQGAGFDLGACADGLAQEDGGVRFAVFAF